MYENLFFEISNYGLRIWRSFILQVLYFEICVLYKKSQVLDSQNIKKLLELQGKC